MKNFKEVNFIVGMPRGGTTWMSRCLNNHSKIASFGESCFFGRNSVNKEIYDQADVTEVMDKMAKTVVGSYTIDIEGGIVKDIRAEISKLKAPVAKKEVFDAMIRAIVNITDKDIVMEKTPHHVEYVGKIRAYYPNSKFIVMQRDPKGFMLSQKSIHLIKAKEVQKYIKGMYHPLICMLNYKPVSYTHLTLPTKA